MGQQQPLPTEDGAAAQGSGAPNALGDYHEVASRGNADDMSKDAAIGYPVVQQSHTESPKQQNGDRAQCQPGCGSGCGNIRAGPVPQPLYLPVGMCPYCRNPGPHRMQSEAGNLTWIASIALILVGCWFVACLPFCGRNSLKDDVVHCGGCNAEIGRYRRI